MTKVCFALALICLAAASARGQQGATARESATPSIEITAATPEPSVAASPDAEAVSPSPVPMRLAITAARTIDGKPETSYRSNAQQIVVRWRGENLPVGSIVRVAWIAEDVGDIVDPGFVIDRDETAIPSPTFSARFTISRPRDGWAPGKYRVDLFVDDVLRDTLGITISD
jgi:hypothetical protein